MTRAEGTEIYFGGCPSSASSEAMPATWRHTCLCHSGLEVAQQLGVGRGRGFRIRTPPPGFQLRGCRPVIISALPYGPLVTRGQSLHLSPKGLYISHQGVLRKKAGSWEPGIQQAPSEFHCRNWAQSPEPGRSSEQ